jgi:opacity protein-like surface antigen
MSSHATIRPAPCGRRTFAAAASALLAMAATLAPAAAQAQSETDGWQWAAAIYVWLPEIDGSTAFPSGAGGPSITIGADQLLENLDFTFMGALHARKDSWGLFTDLIYLNEGGSKTRTQDFSIGPGQVPAGVELDAVLDLKSWVWTVAGTWRVNDGDRNPVDLLFGTRMLDIEQTLNWEVYGDIGGLPLPGRSGSSTVSGTNWDAVVGVRGESVLGADARWILPWHLDVGAGDSDFTWQVMAGVGYRFGWGDMRLTYRYLDYDTGNTTGATSLDFSGPVLGAVFRW